MCVSTHQTDNLLCCYTFDTLPLDGSFLVSIILFSIFVLSTADRGPTKKSDPFYTSLVPLAIKFFIDRKLGFGLE